MKKLINIFIHAFNMVQKNLRSYALLSVTVILSFSFLLGFLLWSDSQIYNKYKEVFSVPVTVAEVYPTNFQGHTADLKIEAFKGLLDKIEAEYFQFYVGSVAQGYSVDGSQWGIDRVIEGDIDLLYNLYLVPNQFQDVYFGRVQEFEYVRFLGGKSQLSSPNEVLIDEYFFKILGGEDKEQLLTFSLPIATKDGSVVVRDFTVVGIVSNTSFEKLSVKLEDGKTSYPVYIYASIDLVEEIDIDKKLYFNINSKYNNLIRDLANELNFVFNSSYRYQQEAMTKARLQVLLKGITISILFFLLGINLFSSFNNALKDRCFEIGVKRAIGASKQEIVLQFFFEALIVMSINILLSVVAVINLAVINKTVQKTFFDNHWIIFMNSYSILLFVATTLILSIVFSLIFAFQSTEVEIVKHLKGE